MQKKIRKKGTRRKCALHSLRLIVGNRRVEKYRLASVPFEFHKKLLYLSGSQLKSCNAIMLVFVYLVRNNEQIKRCEHTYVLYSSSCIYCKKSGDNF